MAPHVDATAEIWFRPHPWTSLAELHALMQNRRLTATPRLGIRDATHPTKGYAIGRPAKLRLFNRDDRSVLVTPVEVTGLVIKPLAKLTPGDLTGCGPAYPSWLEVRKILGFFEKRELHPLERVTIVEFAYLTGRRHERRDRNLLLRG